MAENPFNVLFLCTGSSARSILAEVILNREGQGKFHAFSAGSFPKGTVHPLALRALEEAGLTTEGLRSKSWNEFAAPGAPEMDFVFTVCDNAANEICPVWPGQPITAHWGMADPAGVEGDERTKERAFRETLRMMTNRIRLLVALPIRKLDRLKLTAEVQEIGRSEA